MSELREQISVLKEAQREIENLRQQNAVLRAKVEVVEIFAKFAPMQRPDSYGEGKAEQPDPLWRIAKLTQELERAQVMTDKLKGQKPSWDQESALGQEEARVQRGQAVWMPADPTPITIEEVPEAPADDFGF